MVWAPIEMPLNDASEYPKEVPMMPRKVIKAPGTRNSFDGASKIKSKEFSNHL